MRSLFGFGRGKKESAKEPEADAQAYSPFVCCVCNRDSNVEVHIFDYDKLIRMLCEVLLLCLKDIAEILLETQVIERQVVNGMTVDGMSICKVFYLHFFNLDDASIPIIDKLLFIMDTKQNDFKYVKSLISPWLSLSNETCKFSKCIAGVHRRTANVS